MPRRTKLALVIACALPVASCGDSAPAPPPLSSVLVPTPEEEAGVKKAFSEYKSAILNKQGDKAANLVSESTLAYFEQVRTAALDAREPDLKKLPIVKQLMVLTLRMSASAADVEKMDAKGLFAFSVKEGLIGSDVRSIEPDRVLIRGNEARLGVITGDQTIAPELGYRVARERGSWKVDVMSVVGVDEQPLQKALENVDPDQDLALMKVVEKSVRKPVGRAVWEPLRN